METMSVIVLFAAGALLLWLLSRGRRGGIEKAGSTVPEGEQHRPSFHAVEIRTPDGGCETVRTLRGKRFLSAEAPPIPLPSCMRDSCACYYVHHEDRRARQRRNMHAQQAYAVDDRRRERRGNVGRRAADRILFGSGL